MLIDSSYVFAVFAIIMGTVFFLIVPKNTYKLNLLYGIIFGGFADGLIASISSFLHLIKYKNPGVFMVGGLFPSWAPLYWTFMMGLFFYLLPTKKIFLVLYVCAFAIYAYCDGLVFENFGVFEYVGFFRYVAPIIFLLWFSMSAWFYLRNNKFADL